MIPASKACCSPGPPQSPKPSTGNWPGVTEGGEETVLIAETGGQNAMIVDSSALPEQVVADAIVSAFDSAGQRCSALRVLCVQDDIADRVFAMLEGAIHELVIGDPRHLATDVGPVIDGEAQAALLAHIERMRAAGMRVVQAALPRECAAGTFVPPTVIEIDGIARLGGEVFGPVLHLLRFRRQEMPALIDAINATGYGLTHGIQSRIDETVDDIVAHVRAGNIYVNRNIIGAVVGVQPFGGAGLSGTGPKAGGPLYLRRLLRSSGSASAPGSRPGIAEPMRRQLAALIDGAPSIAAAERARLIELLDAVPRASGAPAAVVLPGPTGESNRWSLHPRGRIGCLAESDAALAEQLIAVLGRQPRNRSRDAVRQSCNGPARRSALRGERRCGRSGARCDRRRRRQRFCAALPRTRCGRRWPDRAGHRARRRQAAMIRIGCWRNAWSRSTRPLRAATRNCWR